MSDQEKIKEEFVELCKEKLRDRLECIVLFGSRARGTAGERSDWDFLIIASELPKHRIKRLRKFKPIKTEIYEKFKENIQVVSFTKEEAFQIPTPSLLYGVMTGFEVLYGKQFWKQLVEHHQAWIKQEKPRLHQGDKTWEIEKII